MKYGYCRVSTSKKDASGQFVQTTDLQRDALMDAGISASHIYEDRISGKAKDRPGLSALLDVVQSGDEVIVWKLDRLGRSVRNLLEVAETLKERGVSIRSLTDGIDTKGPLGGFLLTILGAVAELERETISERVTAGMATAKRSGVTLGRRMKLSPSAREDVLESARNGVSVMELARRYRVDRSTIYDVVRSSVSV
jgi:DNA invertase Pin-like site-specific DNA recombinase